VDRSDAEFADHLDRAWDGLVQRRPLATDDRLARELRAVHALDRTPPGDRRFLARLEEQLMGTPRQPSLVALEGSARQAPIPPNGRVSTSSAIARPAAPPIVRRCWGWAERAIAALLVLGVVGGYVAFSAATPSRDDQPETRLFLTDAARQRLTPLDPETLVTLPDATSTVLDVPAMEWSDEPPAVAGDWVLSADGSTIVSLEFPGDQPDFGTPGPNSFTAADLRLVVRDGRDGRERLRFQPTAPVTNFLDLSEDGRRLLLWRGQVFFLDSGPVATDPQEWYVYDTAEGRLLATITTDEPGPGSDSRQHALLSPDGTRVYRLALAGPPSGPGPYPLRLIVNDAATGDQIGEVALPEMSAGTWDSDRVVNGETVERFSLPAMAVSPDGGTLAVVDAEGPTVTLIDTDRLVVERRFDIESQNPPAVRPPATPEPTDFPLDAAEEGAWRGAVFAADGRGLYLSGAEIELDDLGRRSCWVEPLLHIDLHDGQVVGETDRGTAPIVAKTDGAVYTVSPRDEPGSCAWSAPYVLRRLDPDTLQPEAEREFDDDVSIEVVPRVTD